MKRAPRTQTLTQERLRELLHYDPESGVFTWLLKSVGRPPKGARAGYEYTRSGYRYIQIDGRGYLEHRLVWLYVHGKPPPHQLDHINGVRRDNRLCNLREATGAENQRNCGLKVTNTSGFKGVSLCKRTRRWRASIRVSGKSVQIGCFDTPEAAHEAYCAAAVQYHGEYARTK